MNCQFILSAWYFYYTLFHYSFLAYSFPKIVPFAFCCDLWCHIHCKLNCVLLEYLKCNFCDSVLSCGRMSRASSLSMHISSGCLLVLLHKAAVTSNGISPT